MGNLVSTKTSSVLIRNKYDIPFSLFNEKRLGGVPNFFSIKDGDNDIMVNTIIMLVDIFVSDSNNNIKNKILLSQTSKERKDYLLDKLNDIVDLSDKSIISSLDICHSFSNSLMTKRNYTNRTISFIKDMVHRVKNILNLYSEYLDYSLQDNYILTKEYLWYISISDELPTKNEILELAKKWRYLTTVIKGCTTIHYLNIYNSKYNIVYSLDIRKLTNEMIFNLDNLIR